MNYYGTDLTSKGHYPFEVGKESLYSARYRLSDVPFNPEGLPYKKHQNGDIGFYHFCGLTILAICGSCSDTRPGSKSVFWIEGTYTQQAIKDYLLKNTVTAKMIDQMPFEIKW